MAGGTFGDQVQVYLRASGYLQKDLADALGLHSKVLSRKLNGSGNAHLTQLEIGRIIKTFARWRAITTRGEAEQLLELAGLTPGSFSSEEWQSPPLNQLETPPAPPTFTPRVNPAPFLTPGHDLHNLPVPVTRLIGREWAVERLRNLLNRSDVRLITLIGPGGSGKTRLAQHVAFERLEDFSHGAWFVSLTGVSDPGSIPMSIIQALGLMLSPQLQPRQSLLHFLRDKRLLLILDNFEQVLEASSVVSELLSSAPGLKIIVTSQVVLRLYGEHAFSVPPLDIPDTDHALDAAELGQFASIQLFVERAQAANHDFTLTDDNAQYVAQICARLDGLPLALELAAAQIRLLSPPELLRRFSESRLSTLRRGARDLPIRQQTLRNTIEWSYHLLSADEQYWFIRLGTFNGGWLFEAAEEMIERMAEPGRQHAYCALDILEGLVDKSLVVRHQESNGLIRFTLLETLREYALEQLLERGELERLRDWHACYYLSLAEAAEMGLRGKDQLLWLRRLGMEQDNLRAALEWSIQRARKEGEAESAPGEHRLNEAGMTAVECCLRLASALEPYWQWRGHAPEGRYWLEEALALPHENENSQNESMLTARAKALSSAAWFMHLQSDRAGAEERADESIALWQRINDPDGLLIATFRRGWIAYVQGSVELANTLLEQCSQYLSSTSSAWLRAEVYYYQGEVAGFALDFERANLLLKRSEEIFELLGDMRSKADVLNARGGFAVLASNYTEAITLLVQGMTLGYELGNRKYVAEAIAIIGFATGLRQEPDTESACLQAAYLIGAGEGVMEEMGMSTWLKTQPMIKALLQWMQEQIGEQRWEDSWKAGHSLTLEQAMEQAYRKRA